VFWYGVATTILCVARVAVAVTRNKPPAERLGNFLGEATIAGFVATATVLLK